MYETDSTYYRRRAKEEAWRALRSEQPEVAAAHHGLSVQYAARALKAYADEDEGERSAFPHMARSIQAS